MLLAAFNQNKSLHTSSNLLLANPEYYPAWNYRKRALKLEGISKEALGVELELTMNCIKNNPKSYASWYHRQWIIKQLMNGDDKKDILDLNFDLKLIEKLLGLDSRNCTLSYHLFSSLLELQVVPVACIRTFS